LELLQIKFMNEDLPTLDLPAIAISLTVDGNCEIL